MTEATGAVTAAEIAALAEARGTPLVSDIADDPDHQRLTFVWRENEPIDGVYVLANRLTDKSDVARGMMHRHGDSGVWSMELTVPRGTMAGYSMFPFRDDDPALVDGAIVYNRALVARAVADPLSPDVRDGLPFGSLLRAAGAPGLELWRPGPSPVAAPVDEFDIVVDDAVHRCRVTETGPDPQTLVVMFDADKWFERFDVAAAARRAVAAGVMAPLLLVGVDAPPTPAERLAQLGANESFLRAVAFDAVPRARALHGRTPARTVVAGQSLGGLSALSIAAWCPGVFDDVLAFSPSVWWRPGLTARPVDVAARVEWIHQLLATLPSDAPRFAIAVGANEAELRPNVEDLAETMSANAIRHTLQVFPGGHDFPWWADLLFDHLSVRPQLPFEVHL